MAELHANKMHCRIFPKTGKRRVIGKEIVKPLSKISVHNSNRNISISGKFRYLIYTKAQSL